MIEVESMNTNKNTPITYNCTYSHTQYTHTHTTCGAIDHLKVIDLDWVQVLDILSTAASTLSNKAHRLNIQRQVRVFEMPKLCVY